MARVRRKYNHQSTAVITNTKKARKYASKPERRKYIKPYVAACLCHPAATDRYSISGCSDSF